MSRAALNHRSFICLVLAIRSGTFDVRSDSVSALVGDMQDYVGSDFRSRAEYEYADPHQAPTTMNDQLGGRLQARLLQASPACETEYKWTQQGADVVQQQKAFATAVAAGDQVTAYGEASLKAEFGMSPADAQGQGWVEDSPCKASTSQAPQCMHDCEGDICADYTAGGCGSTCSDNDQAQVEAMCAGGDTDPCDSVCDRDGCQSSDAGKPECQACAECQQQQQAFYLETAPGASECPSDYRAIANEAACQQAAVALGKSWKGAGDHGTEPACQTREGVVEWNRNQDANGINNFPEISAVCVVEAAATCESFTTCSGATPVNKGTGVTCDATGCTSSKCCEAENVPSSDDQDQNQCKGLPLVVPAWATVEPGCAGRSHGSTCRINCPDGPGEYVQVGATHFTCNNNGTWSREPGEACEPQPCNYAPTPLFGPELTACTNDVGSLQSSGLPHGTMCKMRCNYGDVLPKAIADAGGFFACKAGTWQVPGPCMAENAEHPENPAIEVPALILELEVQPSGQGGEVEFSCAWAIENQRMLDLAISKTLEQSNQEHDAEHIQTEVVNCTQLTGTPLATIERTPEATTAGLRNASTSTVSGQLRLRRLQPADPFRVRIAILEGEAQQASSTASNLVYSFVNSLENEVKLAGRPYPVGMVGSSVRLLGRPQYIDSFLAVVPAWVASPLACSNSCGDGTFSREVTCLGGTCYKDKPLTTGGACENYDGCGFEALCPWGRGSGSSQNSFECDYQMVVMLVVFLFILGGFCLVVREICNPKKGNSSGEHEIEDYGLSTFKIMYPEVEAEADVTEEEQKRTADGKIHVIWTLEDAKMKEYFEKTEAPKKVDHSAEPLALALPEPPQSDAPEDLAIEGATDIMQVVLLEEGFGPCSPRESTELESPLCGLTFMYQEGSQLEYHSRSNGTWLPASVQIMVEQVKRSSGGLDTVVMYNVNVHGTRLQKLNNVSPAQLRLPLEDGELVEVFSKRRTGGGWIPGIIKGLQGPRATLSGYKVLLVETTQILDGIPASRIRRRFPAQLPIMVYQGAATGWVSAEVSADADIEEKVEEQDMPPVKKRDWPWRHVPVKILETKEAFSVPAYFIRRCTEETHRALRESSRQRDGFETGEGEEGFPRPRADASREGMSRYILRM